MSALLKSPTSNRSVGRRRRVRLQLLFLELSFGMGSMEFEDKTLCLIDTKDRTFQTANVTQLLCERLDVKFSAWCKIYHVGCWSRSHTVKAGQEAGE